MWSVLGGLIGARLYHVVTAWDLFADDLWAIPMIWKGGLGIPGGLLGGTIAGVLVVRRRAFPPDVPLRIPVESRPVRRTDPRRPVPTAAVGSALRALPRRLLRRTLLDRRAADRPRTCVGLTAAEPVGLPGRCGGSARISCRRCPTAPSRRRPVGRSCCILAAARRRIAIITLVAGAAALSGCGEFSLFETGSGDTSRRRTVSARRETSRSLNGSDLDVGGLRPAAEHCGGECCADRN